jgi:hypothetical protein
LFTCSNQIPEADPACSTPHQLFETKKQKENKKQLKSKFEECAGNFFFDILSTHKKKSTISNQKWCSMKNIYHAFTAWLSISLFF